MHTLVEAPDLENHLPFSYLVAQIRTLDRTPNSSATHFIRIEGVEFQLDAVHVQIFDLRGQIGGAA